MKHSKMFASSKPLSSGSIRKLILFSYIALCSIEPSQQHGRLFEPPSRNTMWRFGFKSSPNYNDNELFCGGIGGIVKNEGKCGICGDPYDGPRLHETGQAMAPNKTVRNYFPGSSIDLVVDVVANHGGTFEFEMCWRDSWSQVESEDCFELLPMVAPLNSDEEAKLRIKRAVFEEPDDDEQNSPSDSFNRTHSDFSDYYELDPGAGTGSFSMSVQLPANRTCENCILRWHWRTANNWGKCEDGSEQIGCGYQEIYRNCADVSVKRDGSGIGLSR